MWRDIPPPPPPPPSPSSFLFPSQSLALLLGSVTDPVRIHTEREKRGVWQDRRGRLCETPFSLSPLAEIFLASPNWTLRKQTQPTHPGEKDTEKQGTTETSHWAVAWVGGVFYNKAFFFFFPFSLEGVPLVSLGVKKREAKKPPPPFLIRRRRLLPPPPPPSFSLSAFRASALEENKRGGGGRGRRLSTSVWSEAPMGESRDRSSCLSIPRLLRGSSPAPAELCRR